jgi:hypothetical protein
LLGTRISARFISTRFIATVHFYPAISTVHFWLCPCAQAAYRVLWAVVFSGQLRADLLFGLGHANPLLFMKMEWSF